MRVKSRLFNIARLLCLFSIFFLLSLLVSCKFEAAIKLLLVHLNLGSYWIEPIRQSNSCKNENILVNQEYSSLQNELPSRLLNSTVGLCPALSPFILNEELEYVNVTREAPISVFNKTLGYNSPVYCIARQRTAVIVPYRNRQEQLDVLLKHLNPILRRQQLDYQIFVIDQAGTTTFSRARLMNAGFLFVNSHFKDQFDCFIFHDVDLLLENDVGLYKCSRAFPRHLSSSIDKYHYTVPWAGITGGVMAFTYEQFVTVNGFSNEYWGWGCEDDDMFIRIVDSCLQLEQADKEYYKYKMLIHAYEKAYKGDSELSDYFRFKMASSANLRKNIDGISNLHYSAFINTTTSQRTIVATDIGMPYEDIKGAFEKRFLLSKQEESETCIASTPIIFLLSVQCSVLIIISILYRYLVTEWNSTIVKTKSKIYELLENDDDGQSIQSDSISIQSFDATKAHKRQPSNGLDSISVQTI